MGNPFVHIELLTQDVEKSKKFYSGLFDCELEELPDAMFGLWQAKGGK